MQHPTALHFAQAHLPAPRGTHLLSTTPIGAARLAASHLLPQAADKLVKSAVVDNDSGEEKDSEVRTSSGTFFDKGFDEVGKGDGCGFTSAAVCVGPRAVVCAGEGGHGCRFGRAFV